MFKKGEVMEFIIGMIIGCIVSNVIFYFQKKRAAKGHFVLTETENGDAGVGVQFTSRLTEHTRTIILTRK